MGLQRSISNLSKALFPTYFYVFASLLGDWGEALFGHNDYYLFAQHKSDPLLIVCVIIIFFACVFLHFILSPLFTFRGKLLEIHICFLLFTCYCIIDGGPLRCTWENLHNDFSLVVVFVCLPVQWKSDIWGIFLSEIIQYHKLLTSCLFHPTAFTLSPPGKIDTSCDVKQRFWVS